MHKSVTFYKYSSFLFQHERRSVIKEEFQPKCVNGKNEMRRMLSWYCTYSEISDSGRSEMRTTSLQRTQLEVTNYFLSIVPVHSEPPKEDNFRTKDKRGCPKVSFIQKFHSIQYLLCWFQLHRKLLEYLWLHTSESLAIKGYMFTYISVHSFQRV